VALEADGGILVADARAGVIRVDPVSGAQTTVSAGRSLVLPVGIAVVRAPLPSSKDQCKKGGWQRFGVFKSQGECVSFAATQGKNPP
jgi:hypothetical protein